VLALILSASPVSAADISGVTISNITTNAATVDWTTSVNTDAAINYGVDANVGIVRDPTFTNKTHTLVLPGLDPFTTYHFRVVSTDAAGNKSATAGFVFTTKGTQADKAIVDIKKITDPASLVAVADAVQQAASTIVLPPSIIGDPNVVVGVDQVQVTWSTDRASDSEVNLTPESQYDASSKDPYSITQGNTTESVTKHSVTVIGLSPFTVYHFSVRSRDALGLTGISTDTTFTTKSALPQVTNIKVSGIRETSAVVSWSTGDVPAKGVVSYTNLVTKATKSAGNPVFLTKQSVALTGLEFGTRYSAIITSTNQAGDNVDSKPFVFLTVRNVIPPVITKVNNESTLFPDDDTKVQTILSWATDEPSTCQVSYVQGLVKSAEGKNQSMPVEANPVTTHLQVMVGFTPGSVYKFWMVCTDLDGNQAQSDDYVLITPVQAKNIIDLILANFQGTFGWVGNIGKK
jgi:hypothetical protein